MDWWIPNDYVIKAKREEDLRAAEKHRLASEVAKGSRLLPVLKSLLYLFF